MKFLEAVLILSGMIIGVGMFGIPFSFWASGFWLGTALLIILSGVMTLLHLLYGEIVMHTKEVHRLPGYIRIYLGGGMAYFSSFPIVFGIVGSLLAYLLIGSTFLERISVHMGKDIDSFSWALFMVVSTALLIRFPLGKIASVNGILTAALIALLLYASFLFLPAVKIEHFSGVNYKDIFLPYGVLLFSLAGGIAIPDLVALLESKRRKVRVAIITGTLIPACIYFIFAFAVVGIAGAEVSEDAIEGLVRFMSPETLFILSIAGFLAVYTSFIILTSNFAALLERDFKFPRFISWASAFGFPFLLYAGGLHSFIAIIGAVGAVAGGIEAAFIIRMYHRIKPSAAFLSYTWKAVLFMMVLAGIVYEFFKIVK